MKIVFFTETYLPQINGVATSTSLFRKYLEKRGHDVFIIAPIAPRGDRKVLKVPGVRFPMEKQHIVSIPVKKRIRDFIHGFDPDVIHSHTPFILGFFALKIQQDFGIPHVHTYHTLLVEYRHYIPPPIRPSRSVVEEFSAWFCNQVDHVIAPTEEIRKELVKYGVEKEITVIPTGIDIDSFRGENRFDVRKKHGIGKDERIILFAGRLAKEKNVLFTLRIFKRLMEEGRKVFFIIVGDGPLRMDIEEVLDEWKMKNKVVLTGYLRRDDLIEYYKQSDLFIFASLTETQGLVVLESLAAGTPVVAIAEKGIKDVLEDGRGALLVKGEDEDDFLVKVKSILDDDSRRERLSKLGIEYVEEKWSMDSAVEKLLKIYGNLSRKRKKVYHIPRIFEIVMRKLEKIENRIFVGS